jgi:hypothetical protein
MKAATVLLLALVLSGCATCERHPIACAVLVGCVVLSVPHIVDHRDVTRGTDGRDVATPRVDCTGSNCK